MLRYLTAGESHGPALVVDRRGPARRAGASPPTTSSRELARRRLGYGRGPRMRFEQDVVTLVGGVRHGRTLGSPVAIEIANSEWDAQPREVAAPRCRPRPPTGPPQAPLTQIRPGHADLAGMQKYGFTDARDVLERASARETAARVAAGTLAKKLLGDPRRRRSCPTSCRWARPGPTPASAPAPATSTWSTPTRSAASTPMPPQAMVNEIKEAAKDGDSLGGVVEAIAYGVPVGLGSHVHWDRKLDAALAQAVMSIQAVKGVEIGDGFEVAGRRGSEAHDPITWTAERRLPARLARCAGGVEGGISTGEPVVVRAAMKPLATLNRPTLATVDTATKEPGVSFKERTDVTAVPALRRGRRAHGGAGPGRRGHPQVRRRLGRRARPATTARSSTPWPPGPVGA